MTEGEIPGLKDLTGKLGRDLREESAVVDLMRSSRSEAEWNQNCKKVMDANGGDYPRAFWANAIMFSGLAQEVRLTWQAKSEANPDRDEAVRMIKDGEAGY